MTFDRSRWTLERYCEIVAKMKPGERLDVPSYELRDINSFVHNEATFTPPDRILGNIMGSAYTHSYSLRHDGIVTFMRHENTGERRHNDPDHAYRLARLKERGHNV